MDKLLNKHPKLWSEAHLYRKGKFTISKLNAYIKFDPCFCFALLSVLSIFAIIFTRTRELIGLLYLSCLLMSCDCVGSVAFPHGPVG